MLKYTFIYLIYRHRGYCTRGHARGKVPSIPVYITISRRINKLNLKLKDDGSSKESKYYYVIIAIDSTAVSRLQTEVSG
jgi:hypothetical protein